MVDVPFIPKAEIEMRALNVVNEFWADGSPVRPKVIWEHRMGRYFDTLPNLLIRGQIEAYLNLDFSVITLDTDLYMSGGHGRMNFSIAHEIGHFTLHRKVLQSDWAKGGFIHPATPSIWKHQLKECDPFAYNRVETQANIFAAYFLMPSKLVLDAVTAYEPFLIEKAKHYSRPIESCEIQEYLAANLANDFQTSRQAMENRLQELQVASILAKKYPPMT